jgi:hypothetical protein
MKEYPISDYDYVTSSMGNAFFSGVSFEQLWNCVNQASSREELDAAVSATIRLNELTQRNTHDR